MFVFMMHFYVYSMSKDAYSMQKPCTSMYLVQLLQLTNKSAWYQNIPLKNDTTASGGKEQ